MRSLNLDILPVTDAGLKELAPLTDLRTLSPGMSVTDAGLMELVRFKKLEYLHLGATPVTDAGVAASQKALPECTITR